MKLKRSTALLSTAAMTMSLFAGFQGTALAEEEPVTINWYRVAWHTNEDEKMVEDAINEYIEPLIGVNVKLMNAAENTELTLSLAAGEDIDMWWDASWSTMNTLIQGSSAYDLTDVIDNYPTLKESIPDVVWESCLQSGKLWYVPIYKESGLGTSLTVPTSIAEKYGWDLSTVKELKDLEPMLEQLLADGVEYPFVHQVYYAETALKDTFATIKKTSIGQAYAVVRRDDPTTVLNLTEQPEYKEYLELMHSWYEKGYINEEEAVSDIIENTVIELRKEGNNGFFAWANTPDGKANASNRFGMDVELIPMTKNYAETDSAAGSVLMVNAKTEKLDAVMKFIELLNTDETLATLATYGIEGEHYSLVDGRVELIADSGYSYPGAWIVCNVTTPTLLVGESEDKKEQYDEFNENLEISVTNGFRFDESNVEAELTAIEGVSAEYLELLERGVYDPEEYLPAFQEALKSAGIDTVIAEAQAQWDAFLAE